MIFQRLHPCIRAPELGVRLQALVLIALRTTDPFPSLGPATRRFVVWLLIGLLPLQAMAASVTGTLGPAHFHVGKASMPVLEDFRRAAPMVREAPAHHVATAFGHFHGAAQAAQRHRHSAGTEGVVVVSGDPADADESGAGFGSASVVALIPSPPAWAPPARRHAAASGASWAPQTHHPDFPERPPRLV